MRKPLATWRAQPARRCGKNEVSPSEAIRLLERRGYHVNRTGRRATCPHCTTGTRDDLTVSINGPLYNCHRCHRGGHVRRLQNVFEQVRQQPGRVRRADAKKRQFQEWLAARMSEMGDRERRLAKKAGYAEAALKLGVGWPVANWAWLLLSDYYQAKRQFDAFWEAASDKCGRLQLYRAWRRGKAA